MLGFWGGGDDWWREGGCDGIRYVNKVAACQTDGKLDTAGGKVAPRGSGTDLFRLEHPRTIAKISRDLELWPLCWRLRVVLITIYRLSKSWPSGFKATDFI